MTESQSKPLEAWVAFLDVYGFSALVQAAPDDGIALFNGLLRLLKRIEEVAQASDASIHAFSDSFFLTYPIKTDAIETLRACLEDLSSIITMCLHEDLPLRGGIARGQVVLGPNLLVGAPILRAHHYEQTVGSPLIILPAKELATCQGSRLYTQLAAQCQDIPLPNSGLLRALVVRPHRRKQFIRFAESQYERAVVHGPASVAAAWRRARDLVDEAFESNGT